MKRTPNLLALLAAGAVTVLAVAGLSTAAATAAPKLQAEPKISGTAVQGQTLTVSNGTWTSSSPITYTYQWKRCDKSGNGCSDIGGATMSSYQLHESDVGHTVRAEVTAHNSDGATHALSNATAVVQSKTAPPPVSVNGCPTGTGGINVTQVSLPARLQIDGQSASPAVVTRSIGDLTLRFHVSACNGRSVAGALVYAAAVPFNQFSISEVPTGADGWATLTEHRLGGFPASSKQQLLAVFVRARKPGENLLGGISTRILVSFPVR